MPAETLGSIKQGQRKDRTWTFFLAAGLAAFAAYFLIFHSEDAHNLLETIINLVCAGAIVAGIHKNKPAKRLGWYFIAAGFFVFGLGNIPTTYYVWVGPLHTQPFPGLGDAGYLLTEPLICVGLLLFIRGRRAERPGRNLLDAGILSVALGFPIYAFLVEPHLHDTTTPLFARLVSSMYPAADLMLIAVAIAFVVGPGRRSLSYRLLLASFIALLASDLAFSGAILAGYFNAGSIINAGWPLFSILGATAALHPSMRDVDQPDAEGQKLSRVRIILLSAAVFSAPVVEMIRGIHGKTEAWAVTVVTGLLFLLTARRLMGFIRDGNLQREELSNALTNLRHLEEERLYLLRRTVEAAENERSRIAIELHDGPIQRLTAASLRMELMGWQIDQGDLSDARAVLGQSQGTLSTEIHALRTLMADLRPPALDERGIVAAIEQRLRAFERDTGLEWAFEHDVPSRIDPEKEGVIYRVLLEGLQNVATHAVATRVEVTLSNDEEAILFTLRDNGRGFEAGASDSEGGKHVGLLALKERLEMAGGRFSVESSPSGSTLFATFSNTSYASTAGEAFLAEV